MNEPERLYQELSEQGHEAVDLDRSTAKHELVNLIARIKTRLLVAMDTGEVTQKLIHGIRQAIQTIDNRLITLKNDKRRNTRRP